MNKKIIKNYFDFFKIKQEYEINKTKLKYLWQNLLFKIHPDNFDKKYVNVEEITNEISIFVNEAYFTLKNPISRAEYICKKETKNNISKKSISLNNIFLEKQIKWYEQINKIDRKIKDNKFIFLKNDFLILNKKVNIIITELIDRKKFFFVAIKYIKALNFIKNFLKRINKYYIY